MEFDGATAMADAKEYKCAAHSESECDLRAVNAAAYGLMDNIIEAVRDKVKTLTQDELVQCCLSLRLTPEERESLAHFRQIEGGQSFDAANKHVAVLRTLHDRIK